MARLTFRQRGYTRRWDICAKLFLGRNPLCRMCEAAGKITVAELVDHIIRHRGDQALMWDESNWQPLCRPCHKVKTAQELGYGAGVGVDGWPIIERRRFGFSIPNDVKVSGIPVHLVCGAPGSGKTTFVRERAKPGDIVID